MRYFQVGITHSKALFTISPLLLDYADKPRVIPALALHFYWTIQIIHVSPTRCLSTPIGHPAKFLYSYWTMKRSYTCHPVQSLHFYWTIHKCYVPPRAFSPLLLDNTEKPHVTPRSLSTPIGQYRRATCHPAQSLHCYWTIQKCYESPSRKRSIAVGKYRKATCHLRWLALVRNEDCMRVPYIFY